MADERDTTENAEPEAPMAAVDQETPAAAEAEAAETPAPRARARRAARASGRRAAARRAAEEKKAASRKRDAEPAVIVRAQAKYVRSSARKARLVCDHIRGKSVEEARAILAFTPRAVARDWSKVLESAVANAEHNHELDGEDLLIKAAHADEGPTLKRFRPRAMGRATPIRKRTSHLTILLTPKG
jgi:ribosomal protein L22